MCRKTFQHFPIKGTITKSNILNKGKKIIPSGVQPYDRRDTESMEVSNAEAVAVWYGSIVSMQLLNSKGDLNRKKKSKKSKMGKIELGFYA